MIIVKVMGGLGNQLFQYALYRQFQENGKEAYLDISWYYENKGADRKYQLDLFNTKILKCSRRQKYQLANNDQNIFGILYHRIFGNKKSHIVDSVSGEFNPSILKLEKGYLDGYWQREEYFKNVAALLHKELVLKIALPNECSKMLRIIEKTNSVAIHVRRGDYLKIQDLCGICTEEYYNDSMEYMKHHIYNVHFFVFSDDLDWCKCFFGNKLNVTFVDMNNENAGYFDLVLMSKCKNMIMANSSFSWWAAWLNEADKKIIISPKRWSNASIGADILCNEWIRI